MTLEPIHVVALGASTALGRDAWSSAAAVRAGITGFAEHPYMIDTAGEPMRVAMAPWLDIDLTGVDRLIALLVPVIDEALEPLASGLHMQQPRAALILGLPSSRPGVPQALQSEISRRLVERFGPRFGLARAFAAGHAAGLLALDAGCKELSHGALDWCVIAGVDSYLDPETLEWLEQTDQLHGAGPLNNAWGFIPGEAAGALFITRASVAEKFNLRPLATVLGTGTAYEAKRIKTETICIGEGLTEAFRKVLAALPKSGKVTDVYCDMNGEPYRADEYGFACVRTSDGFETASDFVAPADCWGDVGAAGASLHVILSTIAGLKNYANGRIALIGSSAESGERAAALLEIPPVAT